MLSRTGQPGLGSSLGLLFVTSRSLSLLCLLKKVASWTGSRPKLYVSPHKSSTFPPLTVVLRLSSTCGRRTGSVSLDILLPSRPLWEGRVDAFVFSCGSPFLLQARVGPSGPPAPTGCAPQLYWEPSLVFSVTSVPWRFQQEAASAGTPGVGSPLSMSVNFWKYLH